jgi:hypothetical protein
MKKWFLTAGLIVLFSTSCLIMVPEGDWSGPRTAPRETGTNPYDVATGMTVGYFYEYLTPYGTWIHHPEYGYVWVPQSMGYRWRPYTHGHWIWSNYGWTWISDFEWGWSAFHYGRWGYDDRFGWFWVPGTIWGPAWVVWRSSDLYFGWAPLPPGVVWRPGYGFGRPFDVPDNYWIFVEGRYFLRSGLYGYALPPERNRTIIRMSQLHQNIRFHNDDVVNEGIDRDVVRRVTRESLGSYDLRAAGRPGRDRVGSGEAMLFRPSLKPDEQARPKKFVERDAAEETLQRGRIYVPDRTAGATGGDAETVLRRRQDEEMKILQRTQDEEIRDITRRFQEKSAAAKEQAVKTKLKKDEDEQVKELQKKHEQEKAAIKERQKKDTEVVRKGAIKKVEKKVDKQTERF